MKILLFNFGALLIEIENGCYFNIGFRTAMKSIAFAESLINLFLN